MKLVGLDGRTYELPPGRTSMGRARDNELIVRLPLVSRWHAAVYYNGQRCAVVDLGSTHGTMLNGQRLPPQKPFPLQAGDQLALAGQLYLEVEESDFEANIPTGIPTGPRPGGRRRGIPPIVVALAVLALILLVSLVLLAVLVARGGG